LVVQEGVPTFERIHEAVSEPVVYMVDRYVVGGYYRVHAEPGHPEQLHPANSHYVPLAFEPSGALPRPGVKPGVSAPNRFYMYGVVARLALLAASYELEATDPEADSVE
jgi:glutamate--cysteine ligase